MGNPEKNYMNINTGNVDTADGWIYRNDAGELCDPVASGEVVEVEKDSQGDWVEAVGMVLDATKIWSERLKQGRKAPAEFSVIWETQEDGHDFFPYNDMDSAPTLAECEEFARDNLPIVLEDKIKYESFPQGMEDLWNEDEALKELCIEECRNYIHGIIS